MRTHHFASRSLLIGLVLAGACTDGPVAPGSRPEPFLLAGEYECIVDLATETMRCGNVPATGGGSRLALSLGVGPLTFTSSWTHSRGNSADEDTSTNSLTLKNNIPQPIGTTDGSTAHPDGSRLVYTSGPTVHSVYSGTVASAFIRLDNPDGTGTFVDSTGTFTNRPYYQYNGLLAQGATSTPRSIRYIYSSNVKSFAYRYRVWAPVQYEQGWITVSPAAPPVLAWGATTTLTGTVYDAYGTLLSEGITWSSSNTAVATVNASTGQVTGVAPGTATITATSSVNAQRTGTVVVTVDAAPAVIDTTPVDQEWAVWAGEDIVIQFSEPVNASAAAFSVECPTGSAQGFAVSGSGTDAITLNPTASLPAATTCRVTVVGSQVSDVDAVDAPDQMSGDYVFSFTVTS